MSENLKILYLEDDLKDVDRVRTILDKEDYEYELSNVVTCDEFISALDKYKYDLVFSNYSFPDFNILSSLYVHLHKYPEVPFFIISGAIDEEQAIDALKGGATDYIKKDYIQRLVPSIRRALQEITERTKRKGAEEALMKSDELFSCYFDSGMIGMIIFNLDKRFIQVNNTYCDMVGYSREELLNITWEHITHLDDMETNRAKLNRVLVGEIDGYALDKRYIRKDGKIIHVSVSAKCVRKENGTVDYFAAFVLDISERMKSEKELHMFEKIVSANSDLQSFIDKEYVYREVNYTYSKYFGKPIDEIIGHHVSEIIGKDHFDNVVKRYLDSCLSGKYIQQEIWVDSPTQGRVCLYVKHNPYTDSNGVISGITVCAHDITERKKAEEDLCRYEYIVNATSDLMAFVDTDYVYRTVNQRFLDAFKLTRNEVIGKTPFDIVGKEFYGKNNTNEYFERCLNGESISYQSWRTLPGFKDYVYLDVTFSPYRKKDGTITGIVISSRDITDLKNQQDLLLEAQQITHLGSWEFNLVKNELSCTDEVYRIFEIDPDQLYSLESFQKLVHPEDRKIVSKGYIKSVRNKTPFEITHRILVKDGRVKYVSEKCQTFYHKNGEPVRSIGTVRDVTEQQQIERMLRRNQKMEAVGQLAGGIAHDFNNLLVIFQSNFELLQDFDIKDEKFNQWIETGLKAVKRGSSLTRRLLSFSKSDVMEKSNISVNEHLTGIKELLARTLTTQIEVTLNLKEDIWLVNINREEFEDAILNLALNARDAIPSGGNLVIKTTNVVLDEEFAQLNLGAKPGEYVLISVSDTGSGIDKKALEHLFEPFYTTKGKEKGTGLGLSMVYGFVKRSKGYIKIYSETGLGTVVRLYLPRSEEIDKEPYGRKVSQTILPGGTETLLLVDDEKDILNATKIRLETLGYEVLAASDGHEALEVFNSHKGQIALLLSDVVMSGGMSGYELAHEVENIEPDIKILLASGFTDNNPKEKILSQSYFEVLSKPYTKMELANKVRNLLDRRC